MGGEIISLVSSSPPPPPLPALPRLRRQANDSQGPRKRKSDEIFSDITENASNSQPREGTRGSRDPARSPPRKTLPVVLELSDLSDSSDFPDAANVQPRRGPLRKDPRQIFHRTASCSATMTAPSTGRPRAGGKLGVVAAPPLRRTFDDPIELSSTPDFGPKVKWVGVPENRHGDAAAACRHDSFTTFSPSPPRRAMQASRLGRQTTPPRQDRARSPRPSATRDPQDQVEVSVQSLVDTPSPFSELSPPRRGVDWDPISSSAPEILPPPRREEDVINIDSDSEDLGRAASISSDESFPDVSNLGPSTTTHHRTSLSRPRGSTTASATTASRSARTTAAITKRGTGARTSTGTSTSTSRPPATKRTAEERARDKHLREAERDRKKREREAAKEQRLKDKARAAALAEVNKVKTDKKISAREMIVDLPASLDEGLLAQVQALLGELGIEDARWDSGPVGRVVRWRRRVRARYDEDRGHYEPIPERVEDETFALALLDADEFVGLCVAEQAAAADSDLASHAASMRRHFPNHTLLYLIQGLDPWMRRNRNLRNRQFAAAVRNVGETPTTTTTSSTAGSRRPRASYVDEEAIESGLLALQVLHGALIHHASAPVETAQWVVTFTQHISTVPYRRRRDEANASAAAFCMDAGQVRVGEGAADTYVRMLQEITRVTAPVAYGIAAECPSVGDLVARLETGGPLALQDCRKTVNKEGDLSDRTIGQALSRRLHRVFTGTDENSLDV